VTYSIYTTEEVSVFTSPFIGRWRPLLGLVAAFLVFVALGSAKPADAASIGSRADSSPSIADPQTAFDCSPFHTVQHISGPFGWTYEPFPVVGNPFTLYSSCINACSPVPFGNFGFFGNCIINCPTTLQPAFGFGPLVCPGPPHTILFSPSPTDVSCGSASNLEVVVSDQNGIRVLDGTQVNFTTTLGYVSTTDGTQRGLAYTSLTIPTRTAGTALITATAGNATAQKVVYVTC
jgi:hypothetical protein